MATDVDPNAGQPQADNSRTSPDATIAANPAEPGQGRLEEVGYDPDEHPWPTGFGQPEYPAPSADAAAAKITARTGFQTIVRDGGERGDVEDARVVEVFPEGKGSTPTWGGPWTKNASDENK